MAKGTFVCALLLVAAGAGWAKTARSYYDAETMERVRAKVEAFDWAQAQVEAAADAARWHLQFSDEELWQFVPPPEQIRAINVHIGHDCPICGDEITRRAGHYPWEMDRDRPFKLTCPVCGTTFPDNDFEPWNTEGLEGEPERAQGPDGPVIDRGLGWVGPDGLRYWFVPYYIFWQRWVKDIIGGMETLGQAYLLTGDPRYGHACAVMMARVASPGASPTASGPPAMISASHSPTMPSTRSSTRTRRCSNSCARRASTTRAGPLSRTCSRSWRAMCSGA